MPGYPTHLGHGCCSLSIETEHKSIKRRSRLLPKCQTYFSLCPLLLKTRTYHWQCGTPFLHLLALGIRKLLDGSHSLSFSEAFHIPWGKHFDTLGTRTSRPRNPQTVGTSKHKFLTLVISSNGEGRAILLPTSGSQTQILDLFWTEHHMLVIS